MAVTLDQLIRNQKELLTFLKSRYHLYHLSNVFFRDLHYGVMAFAVRNGKTLSYAEGERLTKGWVASLESSGVLRRLDDRTWLLRYPEFKLVAAKPAVPAKPAAAPGTPLPQKPAAAPSRDVPPAQIPAA